MKTPMSSDTKLMKDEECESVDSTKYRGMIGSLLYLTASRPDIMFSVCLSARFQKDPKTSHLEAVKRIFRYIKCTTHLRLWYPKGTGIETIIYVNSDHAGDYVDQKSTSDDSYILYDRVMYPLAAHYKQKTRADHGMKICHHSNSASSSSIFVHTSPSHHLDDYDVENEEDTSRASTPSPSQFVNSLSNVVPQVFENPPHENQTMHTYQTEILNQQSQYRDENQNGLRSIGRALKNVFKGRNK
ncbi:hypothetical protein Tco_0045774 [Tanacetum coccineum]